MQLERMSETNKEIKSNQLVLSTPLIYKLTDRKLIICFNNWSLVKSHFSSLNVKHHYTQQLLNYEILMVFFVLYDSKLILLNFDIFCKI